MNKNTVRLSVFDVKDNFLGYEIIDIRFDRHDIIKLLNKKYAWKWEYYEKET